MHMLMKAWILAAPVVLAQQDYTQYVDVFFGTAKGGNMFPGVVPAPFSAVKIGPDYTGDGAKSGFNPTGNISGFSIMHLSGTGGTPKYGTVSQLPVNGKISNPLSRPYSPRSAPDNGTIGHYKTSLANGIVVELAGTDHVGYFQYSFPANISQPAIIVDISQYLTGKAPKNLAQSYSKGSIQTFDDGHYEGSGTYSGGWNLAPDWTVYLCGRFNETPSNVQTFTGDETNAQAQDARQQVTSTNRVASIFRFSGAVITSRVSYSFVSTRKACQFIDNETPSSLSLAQLVSSSKRRWNQEVLSKITTSERNTTLLSQLYTSLYGMHILPTNRTGDNPNPKWDVSTPYYDDFYTLWDLFRCTTPLYQILQPTFYEEMIRSLIGIFKVDGYLPDGRSSNYNGRAQGGSNADNVLADAYVKGVKGKVNWNDAYEAMRKDAEVTPPNNNDPLAPDSSTQQGRSALPDWLKLGFITMRFSRSVSRAVEYSANDFALYQVAKGLGKTSDANKYLHRSRNWRNHFDLNARSLGTSGFVVPRDRNLQFQKQDPLKCDGCYWDDPYYEGKPWEYTVSAHHDIATLITYDGGAANFSRRLNTLLDTKLAIADLGNEPSFGSPYLYNFINQQARSVKISRSIARTQYGTGPGGLAGNSDAGAMQSWLLWNMIGLYPLTGQTTFLIHSPWFADLTIDLGGGKSLKITSSTITTADGNSTINSSSQDSAIYVQSLKVNGRAWTQNWLTYNDVFANGGTLAFELGTNMTQWDTGPLPPSPASGGSETGASSSPMSSGDMPPGSAAGLESQEARAKRQKTRKIAIGVGVACGLVLLGLLGMVGWWWFGWHRRRRRAMSKSTGEQAAGRGGRDGSASSDDDDDMTKQQQTQNTDRSEQDDATGRAVSA